MPSLAMRLRSETRALHTSAEPIAFMRTLLRGRMLLHAYVALRRNLHAIYAALEPALLHHALRPAIAPVLLPALWRVSSLRADLEALHCTPRRKRRKLRCSLRPMAMSIAFARSTLARPTRCSHMPMFAILAI